MSLPSSELPRRAISSEPLDNTAPARWPQRAPFGGDLVRWEPLDPNLHAAELYAASHRPGAEALWAYLPYGPFADLQTFQSWLGTQARSEDPLFFAARDLESGEARGMASFAAIAPEHRSIEIAHIWLGPQLQNTRAGTEALYLLMKRAFELEYRRLEWKCDAMNAPSRSAAARLGFGYEGTFYQHRIVRGRNRDTAWFSLLDREWPAVQGNFCAWLSSANWTAEGTPGESLRAMNARLRPDGG